MLFRTQIQPVVRLWTRDDIPGIVACHRAVYPEYRTDDAYYDADNYIKQQQAFPAGQLLVEVAGVVAAYATSFIVQWPTTGAPPRYQDLTDEGTFSNHQPAGDTLYGADIGVRPAYRGQGLSHLLYRERRRLLRSCNLQRAVAYGRIPGYSKHADRLSAQAYVDQVMAGELNDPSLSVHLRMGYSVLGVYAGILEDEPSMNHCTLLEMTNPHFVHGQAQNSG